MKYTDKDREEKKKGFMRKEIKIVEKRISDSTIDLWVRKGEKKPPEIYYEIYKCFVFEFELASCEVMDTKENLYHYTLKSLVFNNDLKKDTKENAKQYYDGGDWLDKETSSVLVEMSVYRRGKWYASLANKYKYIDFMTQYDMIVL